MLSISRLCSRGLAKNYSSYLPYFVNRNLHSSIKKNPNSIIQSLKGLSTRLGKFSVISKLTVHPETVALRYASAVNKKSNKIIGSWLIVCSGMVFVAVALGTLVYAIIYGSIKEIVEEIIKKTYGK